MNILAIETTGAKASVALINEEDVVTVENSEETMNHLQHLIPMIDTLLSKCGLKIDDVTEIAVSEGPGSFTGIRIGMATAKALAQNLELPMVCVPTLTSFGYHVPDYIGLICPIFNARRNQVYAGAYQWVNQRLCSLVPDGAYDILEFLEKVEQAVVIQRGKCKAVAFFGDGIDAYQEQIQSWRDEEARNLILKDTITFFAKPERRYQEAESVAKLGKKLIVEGKAKTYAEAEPVYLRKAEAQRKLEERLAGEKEAQK